jgi:hypothetical protein
MSSPRIGLVCEGPTDFIVIEAALKACLRRPFVLTQLQPERTRPEMQGGWGGVFKWCRALASHGFKSIEDDPTLAFFDLVIVHVDADVASFSYSDVLPEIPGDIRVLPCSAPCPPPGASVDALRRVIFSWLGTRSLGAKGMLCIPSKATDAWLAAAVVADIPTIMKEIECTMNMTSRLESLPKKRRIRKSKVCYQEHAPAVEHSWQQVTSLCSQAMRFQDELSKLAIYKNVL